MVLFDVGAFGNPAGGAVSTAGLDPAELFVPGVGAVFAFGIAAFIGFESGAIYSEECRDPRRTVARATFIALAFTGVLLRGVGVGDDGRPSARRTCRPRPPRTARAWCSARWPSTGATIVADIANVLFLTSVFAALLSFHNSVARYLFALGRERVLPAVLEPGRRPVRRPGRRLADASR